MIRRERYSKATQLAVHTAMTSAARRPKMATLAMAAGHRAMITSNIMPVTVAGPLTWGDALTVSFAGSFIT